MSMAECRKYPHIPGTTLAESYAMGKYKSEGWDALDRRSKTVLIRYRMQAPLTCPLCGCVASLELYNKSGDYRDDNADYGFACHSCNALRRHGKPPGSSRRLLKAKQARITALLYELELKRPDLDLVSHLKTLLP